MSDVWIRYIGNSRLRLGPGGTIIGNGDTIAVEKSVAESLKDSAHWEPVKDKAAEKTKGDL